MATPEILNDLWEELAAPSARAFRIVLARRGIKARAKDVDAFVASKSELQIIALGVKFFRTVVAFDQDERWAADIINCTSGQKQVQTESL